MAAVCHEQPGSDPCPQVFEETERRVRFDGCRKAHVFTEVGARGLARAGPGLGLPASSGCGLWCAAIAAPFDVAIECPPDGTAATETPAGGCRRRPVRHCPPIAPPDDVQLAARSGAGARETCSRQFLRPDVRQSSCIRRRRHPGHPWPIFALIVHVNHVVLYYMGIPICPPSARYAPIVVRHDVVGGPILQDHMRRELKAD